MKTDRRVKQEVFCQALRTSDTSTLPGWRKVLLVLGVLAVVGPLSPSVQAQWFMPRVNPNIYVNPMITAQRYAANAAILGQALQARNAVMQTYARAQAGIMAQALQNRAALANIYATPYISAANSMMPALQNRAALIRAYSAAYPYPAIAAMNYAHAAGRLSALTNYASYAAMTASPYLYGALSAPAYPVGGYNAMLANSFGGYGGLYAGGYGGYGGYGMYGGYGGYFGGFSPYLGLGQNVYQGYLYGAASVTNADAQYQKTIQQAKLIRQEAVRSRMDTRRKMVEEAEYERMHMPDPEKIRQENVKRQLEHARVDPPLADIWSADALNTLLAHLIKMQGQGERGPNVPLSEDILREVNLTTGESRANPGLLRDNGALQWPTPLLDPKFKEPREDLNRRLKEAVNAVKVNREADKGTIKDLRADLQALTDALEANVQSLSPAQYIDARRYLNMLGHAIKALEDPNISDFLNQKWVATGKNVAELVKFMGERGLRFAPAIPGEEPAYRALYHALAAYDAGMREVTVRNDPR
jgi:hypothetical protein